MKDSLQKYRARLKVEAIIKSVLWGLVVGGSAAFIVALITWFFNYNGIFISIGLGLGIMTLCGCLFYFLKFKPQEDYVAERVDSIGLQERLITMHEYRNDNSVIARMQREDAMKTVSAVAASQTYAPAKKIKLRVGVAAIVVASIVGVMAIGMTVVSGLSAYSILPGGNTIIGTAYASEQDDYKEVIYLASDGGQIMGEDIQAVKAGEDSSMVVAVAMEGYAFVCWDDEDVMGVLMGFASSSPERIDTKVNDNIQVTAIFMPVQEGGMPFPMPGQPGQQGPNGQPSQQLPDGPDPDDDGNQAGGSYSTDANKVIDGQQDYNDVKGGYADEAHNSIANGEVGGEAGDVAENYFGAL